MKITNVRVENYRSIADLDINFDHGCQALIGINESGKSNILRALQLLDPNGEVKPTDLRIERASEKQVDAGAITFHIELEADEVHALTKALVQRFDAKSYDQPLMGGPNGVESLRQFCQQRASGLYRIDIPSGKRASNYWALPKSYTALPGWRKNETDSAVVLKRHDGKSDSNVPPNGFVFEEGIDPSLLGNLSKLATEDVSTAVGEEVRRIILANLPKCIFWKYSEQYLLPSSINVTSFGENPDSCIPLRSMFELAQYKAGDLATILAAAKAHSLHRYNQVLKKAADAATTHIRKVWKDHKNIRIDLLPNGELLVPLVTEAEVPLDMASRSDGFKRLVSFLLQVSAKVRTSELKNVLLLIDEPEIALHPRGAKNLMRELITIGESNTVVYSTHSIFMVDRTAIDRHLIVEKDNEITTARRAEKSRILDEEVLFAAMGYSVFEALKERNVIFEGWRDKEIFRIVCDAMGKSDKDLKADFSTVGMTFAEGVKDVKHVARLLELASRECLILSDSDTAAVQMRREYEKQGSWGKWVTLQDILGPNVVATTAEDLILREAVVKRANRFRSKVRGLSELSIADWGAIEPTLPRLKRWLRTAPFEGDGLDTALSELKLALFDKLKRDELSDSAEALVSYVRAHDFSAK